MLEYAALNKPVFEAVPATAMNILDVGCGTGSMGNALLAAMPRRNITGITYSAAEAKEAGQTYRRVYVHDLNDLSLNPGGPFDCIIFSHVLEHTMQPAAILRHYVQYLDLVPGAMVVVALPNVLFFKQRWEFIKGNFRYSSTGWLMDDTHFRFFDFSTAKELVSSAGLEIIAANGYGAFPLPFFRRILPRFSKTIDKFACRLWPGLFSFQYVITGRKPGA